MSDHFIRIVPLDPRFVPTKQAQKAGVDIVRAEAPRADDVLSETEEHIVFRDCGENFERVRCPACANEIEIATWQEWMDGDYSPEEGFRLGPVTTPCCNHRTTLNDLQYDMAQGFSRYALSAINADLKALPADVLVNIASVLGCQVRIIYQMI